MEGVAKAISSKAEEEFKQYLDSGMPSFETIFLIRISLMRILLKQKLQTRILIFLPHKS